MEPSIDDVIASFSGTIGFDARDLTTGHRIQHLADHTFPTASVIKLIVMADAFARAANDSLDLTSLVPILPDDVVGGSGILDTLSPNLELPVIDIIELMITLSDNTATNVLVRLLGLEAINATARVIGMRQTVLHGPVSFEKIDGEFKNLGTSSPEDCALFLTKLATGEIVDVESSRRMIAIMRRQQYLDCLPRYLAYNPYADEVDDPSSLWVANKTGSMPGIRNDVALIGDDQGMLVIAAFSKDSLDHSFKLENEGSLVLGRLGQMLHDAFRA